MEKLKRITVQGFRSIRKLDLGLRELTVLIGANGSGKSNFIGLFTMVSYMLSESLQQYVGLRGGGISILHYGPKTTPTMRVELEFEDKERSSRSDYQFSLTSAAPDRLIYTDEYVRFQTLDKEPFEHRLGVGQLETKLIEESHDQKSKMRRTASVFVERLKDLQAYHFHDTSDDAFIRKSQDIHRNRFLMNKGGNLAAYLYMLQETKPQHFNRILTTVRMAVPYLKEFVLEPSRLDPQSIMLRWKDRAPDYEFGPHQLSDGSLRAIALITLLLQPDELMPNLILLDEPELGLHPAAIGLVASLVKSLAQGRQVIVATQSARFLAEFSPEDVVVVERIEDDKGYGESVYNQLTREELGTWLQDYDLGTLYEMQVTGGGPQ